MATGVIEDFYELLRQKMDKWPIRTPKSKDIMKILRELFTEEEAEILSYFKAPFMDLATPIEIAQRSGKPAENAIEILNSLAQRGLMFKIGKSRKRAKFTIWPTVIGIFEFVFSNAKIYSDEKLKRLARLFDNYLNRYIIPTAQTSNYPFSRVVPSKTSEKVIEINKDLGIVSQKICAFEEVEDLINQCTTIATMPCSCRVKAIQLGYTPKTLIDVCMTFDISAEFFIENGMAKRLSKEEALDLLVKCERNGLVHCTLNAQKPNFICNCDKEFCGMLKPLSKFHRFDSPVFDNFRSNFLLKIDESIECNECYRCVDLCPTHAIYPSIEDGGKFNLELNRDLCIGCGICSSNCSAKRLFLEKVENKIPVETMREAYRKYAKERFKNKLK
ncbi:MAG: 4Fe-4S dicluster domain-containing protein [Candidatus Hodarchaeota archaeon]